MNDALKGYLALATGLTEVTKAKATSAAKALVAQGEAAAGQVTALADDLVSQSKSNREAIVSLVKFEVDKALGRVGLASQDEVAELTARIRSLEGQLKQARDGAAPSKAPVAAVKAPVKAPVAAKKAAVKAPVAAKAPAKQAATKKNATKKATPKASGA